MKKVVVFKSDSLVTIKQVLDQLPADEIVMIGHAGRLFLSGILFAPVYPASLHLPVTEDEYLLAVPYEFGLPSRSFALPDTDKRKLIGATLGMYFYHILERHSSQVPVQPSNVTSNHSHKHECGTCKAVYDCHELQCEYNYLADCDPGAGCKAAGDHVEPTKPLERIDATNKLIQLYGINIGKISDGYHTFDELYEHRIELYLKLAELVYWITRDNSIRRDTVWCSKLHSDGTSIDGWFLLGINQSPGDQITYHLPMKYWDRACQHVVKVLDKAPEFDGHTSQDVLERLRTKI